MKKLSITVLYKSNKARSGVLHCVLRKSYMDNDGKVKTLCGRDLKDGWVYKGVGQTTCYQCRSAKLML